MILTNPYITVEAIDVRTNEPWVRVTADDAPVSDFYYRCAVDLVFTSEVEMRALITRLDTTCKILEHNARLAARVAAGSTTYASPEYEASKQVTNDQG